MLDYRAGFVSTVPLGRPSTPDDVANACSYLASDEASFVTGVNLEVVPYSFPGILMLTLTRLMEDAVFELTTGWIRFILNSIHLLPWVVY